LIAVKSVGGNNSNRANPTEYVFDHDTGEVLDVKRQSLPGYIHFKNDACFDDEYFAQLTAEKLVTKKRAGRELQEWVKVRARNEALDCIVYALAAFRLVAAKKGIKSETQVSDQAPPQTKQKRSKQSNQSAPAGRMFD